MEATYHAPCYYQPNPRQSWNLPNAGFTNRTPSASVESRQNWAFREFGILTANHKYDWPTHAAVVKFKTVTAIQNLKDTRSRLFRNLRYYARTRRVKVSGHCVHEIEANNVFHLHLLLRTDLENPADLLTSKTAHASRGAAELKYCDLVKSVEAVSRYTVKHLNRVKDGSKEVLLFEQGLGLHLASSFGGYFKKPKSELWAEFRRDHFADRRGTSERSNLARLNSRTDSNGMPAPRLALSVSTPEFGEMWPPELANQPEFELASTCFTVKGT